MLKHLASTLAKDTGNHVWIDAITFCSFCSLASAIVCGATSFASGVIVEPFRSTIVGSEIYYQCQPGGFPEERTTLLCGEDGRWNPDPLGLCTGECYEAVLLIFHIHLSSLPTF